MATKRATKRATERTSSDLQELARDPGVDPRGRVSRISRVSGMAAGLVGSEILKIASEIRVLTAGGRAVCNLTVGDFDPREFPIPERLAQAVEAALRHGETN